MNKGFVVISFLLFIISCSPFSRFSKNNQFLRENCPDSNKTISTVSNVPLGISTITFGDFKFALSNKEFKTVNPSRKPQFRDILFYGITDDYEYYVLLNFDGKIPDNFVSNDTVIKGNRYTLVASETIHNYDFGYLKTHMYSYGTHLAEKVCF